MDTKDRFGACVVCHKDMVIERVADGKVVRMFSPEHNQTRFILKDGSEMPVCVCTPCKERVDFNNPDIQDSIMKSVIAGWEWETKKLVANDKRPEWDESKANKYMEDYSKHEIHCHKGDK